MHLAQHNIQLPTLLDYDLPGLVAFCQAIGERPFRAQQILRWVHQSGVVDPQAMSNIAKGLRNTLSGLLKIPVFKVAYAHKALDGTQKWLLQLTDSNCIETVFIPEKSRGTLCLSSQVGCVLNCDFCATGKQGFNRNLSTAEIIGQLWFAVRALSKLNGSHDHTITNIVMMGMGEPLLNLANLIPALNVMLDANGYGLAKRRVTVSTAGVVPAIYDLTAQLDVSLAISLHAANDDLRDQLVPLNKKYPLAALITACKAYCAKHPRRKITMEYVMLKQINDSAADAKQLIKLLHGMPVKINLIPFNPFQYARYQSSPVAQIMAFQKILMSAGIYTSIRKTRGDDIAAACGQLVGQVNDRTQRQASYRQQAQQLPH
jgi:23S rRNA (adenine2503-C2)-methyltransferase